MSKNEIHPPTGSSLRHRVRALTVGVTGAAVLATAAVTATMAYAQAGSDSAGSASTGSAAGTTTITGSGSSAGSATSTNSGALTAPLQPPTGTNNTVHAGSGGS